MKANQEFYNLNTSRTQWLFRITAACNKCGQTEIKNDKNSLRIDRGNAAYGSPNWLCACGSRKWSIIERQVLHQIK